MSHSHDTPGRSTSHGSNGAVDLDLIASDLARVEESMVRLLTSREPLLSEVALHLIQGGGKRVRPAVALLVFKACGGTTSPT